MWLVFSWIFRIMTWSEMARNVKHSYFISFVNELDYSFSFIPRKHARNERVTSAEELGTMSKNNYKGITLEIRINMEDSVSYFSSSWHERFFRATSVNHKLTTRLRFCEQFKVIDGICWFDRSCRFVYILFLHKSIATHTGPQTSGK